MAKPNNTLLVVEDEIEILALIAQLLTNAGYDVLRANTPMDALSICERSDQRIDLVLSDYNLPALNGIELSDKLREIRPDLKIILMSGNGNVVDLLEAQGTFLPKPVDFDELLHAISKMLESSLVRK